MAGTIRLQNSQPYYFENILHFYNALFIVYKYSETLYIKIIFHADKNSEQVYFP